MEITGQNYRVSADAESSTVAFEGSIRLEGTAGYAPIVAMLAEVLAKKPEEINIDLRKLQFLNSSGISVLAKFTIAVRNDGGVRIRVTGSKSAAWQGKSLPNLKKLMPALDLVIE